MEALQVIDSILCPQLEFLMGSQHPEIVQQFIDRYNHGHARCDEKLDKYLKAVLIQSVLQVYQLDQEKFWYLLLFATDFTKGLGSFFTPNPTPIEQFESVFPLIEANLKPHAFSQYGGYVFKDDPNMKLTLTVKKPGMKRSTVVSIDTPNALALLAGIYRQADKSNPLFNRSIDGSMDRLDPPVSERLACFYKLIMPILQPLKAQKRVVTRDTPIDKRFLISQLADLMELTSDDPKGEISYSDPMKTRRFWDNVKDYMSVNIYGLNEHYTFDFLADE